MKKFSKPMSCCLSIVFVLLCLTGPALAADWNQTLRNSTCTQSKSNPKGWGCHAYIYYRIVQGKEREKAKKACTYGCKQIHPGKLSTCQAGCNQAAAKDTGSW